MTNTTGMVVLAGIALLAGGIKIVRGDYQLGGLDRPLRCSDLRTPEGQKVQLQQVADSIEEGKKVLAQLKAENTKYAPGTVVNLRSCDGSVQTITVPPGGIHAQKIQECQAKLLMAQQYYNGLRQNQGKVVKTRTNAPAAQPVQLVQNQVPARPASGPIISQPAPAPKLGAGNGPMNQGQCRVRTVSVPTPEQKELREAQQTQKNIQDRGGMNAF